MKKLSTLFLKVVLLLLAAGMLAWMIAFPQLEGRAVNVDLISIYTDPFIIYGYIASIPFFIGVYYAFRLVCLIDAHKTVSHDTVTALRNVKYASLSSIGFIALGVLYIRLFAQGDDPAGPTALGILTCFVAAVIATTAAVFQKQIHGKLKK